MQDMRGARLRSLPEGVQIMMQIGSSLGRNFFMPRRFDVAGSLGGVLKDCPSRKKKTEVTKKFSAE